MNCVAQRRCRRSPGRATASAGWSRPWSPASRRASAYLSRPARSTRGHVGAEALAQRAVGGQVAGAVTRSLASGISSRSRTVFRYCSAVSRRSGPRCRPTSTPARYHRRPRAAGVRCRRCRCPAPPEPTAAAPIRRIHPLGPVSVRPTPGPAPGPDPCRGPVPPTLPVQPRATNPADASRLGQHQFAWSARPPEVGLRAGSGRACGSCKV